MRFYWDDLVSVENQRKKADKFSNAHIRLRQNIDNLIFFDDSRTEDKDKYNLFGIQTNFDNTNTTIRIIDENENMLPIRNILAAVNILELGIEIVKIIKYSINEDYYYLDGEIIKNVDDTEELVRMPVALISVSKKTL